MRREWQSDALASQDCFEPFVFNIPPFVFDAQEHREEASKVCAHSLAQKRTQVARGERLFAGKLSGVAITERRGV